MYGETIDASRAPTLHFRTRALARALSPLAFFPFPSAPYFQVRSLRMTEAPAQKMCRYSLKCIEREHVYRKTVMRRVPTLNGTA